MAELNQIQDSSAIFVGWYGTCENDTCQDFPLTSTAIRSKIQKVFQTSSVPKNDGYASFDGTIDSSFDGNLQSFTKLECGKSYIIVLKPGVSSLIIDEFSYTDMSNGKGGLVTDDCSVVVTPTPKPTPTPKLEVTPTPKPETSECKCAPSNFTNIISIGDTFNSDGHTFSAFESGSEISYDKTSLESSIASVVSFKFPNGSQAGLIVFSGVKPNNSVFYYRYGITCYTAIANDTTNNGDDEWELVLSVDKKLSDECGDDIIPDNPPTPTPIQPTPTPTPEPQKLSTPVISGTIDIQMTSLKIGVKQIDSDAQLLKIDISLDENFSNIIRTDTEVASTVNQSGIDIIPNLTPDTFYYIRMYVTANNFLDSEYSTTFGVATLDEATPTPTPIAPTPTPEQPTPTPEQPTPTPEQPKDCCADYENNVKIESANSPITFRGITINFGQIGNVCIDELNQDVEPEKKVFWFGNQSASWFGSINTDYPIINNKIRYTDSDGVCYEGELNASPPNGQYNILTEI